LRKNKKGKRFHKEESETAFKHPLAFKPASLSKEVI
jgi:hypothetical protein